MIIEHDIANVEERYKLPIIQQVTDPNGGGRYYVSPSGDRMPSASTITKILGREDIARWKARVGTKEAENIGRVAAARGTGTHNLLELFLLKEHEAFNRAKMKAMPDMLTPFSRIRDHLVSNMQEVRALELRMWSDMYRIAGTVDCVGVHEGNLRVIDFKTSSKPKRKEWIPGYFIQASAYAQMWNERFGEQIDEVAILIANDIEPTVQVFVEPVKPWLRELGKLRLQFYKENGF